MVLGFALVAKTKIILNCNSEKREWSMQKLFVTLVQTLLRR
jgi:hypothetical protein